MEDYDLNGIEVTSTALTWAPYYTIENCNHLGANCNISYGYLLDYIDAIAKGMNFTFMSHQEGIK